MLRPRLNVDFAFCASLSPVRFAFDPIGHTFALEAPLFQHGVQLKAATAMVRLRLYSCLLRIPPKQYDGAFANLLRQLGKYFL